MSTPAPSIAAPVEQQSALTRVVNVFVAPGKAFVGLDRKASWLVPFLVLSIFTFAFVATVDFKVGFDKVTENQIKLNAKAQERLEKLAPEQRARQLEMSTKITKYMTYCAPLMMLIFTAIIAAVLLGTFNFGMGASLRFGSCFSVVMYSWLPSIVKSTITIVALLAGMDPDGFNIRNPVATNPGALIDASAHPALAALLTSLDVVQIWVLIVAAIGFATITGKKRGTCFAVVFGWFAVMTLASVAMAGLF